MYFQNDANAPDDFYAYACLFSDCLASRPFLGGEDWTLAEGVEAWKRCRSLGIISGDLNGDGDFDDPGEDEIQRYDRLFQELKLPLRAIAPASLGLPLDTDGRLLPVQEPLDLTRYWVIEGWYWKILHFVVGDGTGKLRPRYDSIKGGSLTRDRGRIVTLRVFEIVRPT